jgi:hypothetical protein
MTMMSKEEFMALPMEEAANIASERGIAAMQRASAAVAGAKQPGSEGGSVDEQQIKKIIDENLGKGSDAILGALKKAGALAGGKPEPDGDEAKPPMDGPPKADQPPKDDEPPMDDSDPMAAARLRAAKAGAAKKPPFGGGGGMPNFGK